jgi:hypothetical protein
MEYSTARRVRCRCAFGREEWVKIFSKFNVLKILTHTPGTLANASA